jgi:hypothetical protein
MIETHECHCLTNEKLQAHKEDLQKQVDILKTREYNNSYLIENQRKRIEDLGKALKLLTKENAHLWGLVGLQAAEKHV